MLKTVIVLLMLALLASLGSGFYFLMKDQGDKTKRRTMHSLGVRLTLAICLAAVVVGVALNWFGDSLDGSLARYRHTERPRFGFLVDHTCDLFSQILIIVAFALSPFLTLVSALVVLLCYLLFSAYTYIRAAGMP